MTLFLDLDGKETLLLIFAPIRFPSLDLTEFLIVEFETADSQ
jgi:hypothetical protein